MSDDAKSGQSESGAGAPVPLGITVIKHLEANRQPLPMDPAERRRAFGDASDWTERSLPGVSSHRPLAGEGSLGARL